jgi:ABC-type uncharacterized transport system permease subunit
MLVIEDRFQNYMQEKFNKGILSLLNEIVFYGIFVYYYYFGPIQDSDKNFKILTYIIAIFILRYMFHYITKYTIIDDSKEEINYFQFNSRIAIFTILIVFLALNNDTQYTVLSIVFSYAILSSAAKYGYTVDNLITVGITYFIVSLKGV